MNIRAAAAAFLLAIAAASPARAAGDAVRGQDLYHQCQTCHGIDASLVGPMHRGVYGRKAGAVPGFNYSDGLRNSGIVWTEETLDKWLSGPQALVKGARMFFHLAEPQDRADVIAYLKTLK